MPAVVVSNESNKNLEENKLKDLELLKYNVFFGVNGSGKSTVCETLASKTKFELIDADQAEPLYIYAFDKKWQEEQVGSFVEGGTADGVVTVNLDTNAGEVERQLSVCADEKQSLDEQKSRLLSKKEDLENKKAKVLDTVFDGERAKLEERCSALSGKKLNRRAIEKILVRGKFELLSPAEIEENIKTANANRAGYLPEAPSLPSVKVDLKPKLWKEIIALADSRSESEGIAINDWVTEGLVLHENTDECRFCGNKLTEDRRRKLTKAIEILKSAASDRIKELQSNVLSAKKQFGDFLNDIRHFNPNLTVYGDLLTESQNDLMVEVVNYRSQLDRLEAVLTNVLRTNAQLDEVDPPVLNYSKLADSYKVFSDAVEQVRKKIDAHESNKRVAEDALKQHCCSVDGSIWRPLSERLEEIEASLHRVEAKIEDNRSRTEDLNSQISTTSETASFLDENLRMILGENSLSVKEGEHGQGYLISRHGESATSMSEGEKKLVALLYFCAEFRTEDRKEKNARTIVLLDDIGTELDEGRLLAVDRFLADHFRDFDPLSVAYFTHSHNFFRILRNRLGKKAMATEKNGVKKDPTAIFYEIFKPLVSQTGQTTEVRKWDANMVNLTNDYWLALYLVVEAFLRIPEGDLLNPGVGNSCRKVLEGFTDFKSPGNSQFGSRLDTLLGRAGIDLSPSLSKLANELSHSDLQKSTGVLIRSELELCVNETLRLMFKIDRNHLYDAIKYVESKEVSDTVISRLKQSAL